MGMVINGFDLVDFRQQLGIGRLRVKHDAEKDEGKGSRGSLDHGRMSSGLARERVNPKLKDCKMLNDWKVPNRQKSTKIEILNGCSGRSGNSWGRTCGSS